MIRRTLQGGLVAAVAMFALVPTAAVAAEGDHAGPASVVATVPHRPHTLLPVPARHTPVRHRAHRFTRHHHHYVRHTRRVHHVTGAAYHHRARRVVGRVATQHRSLNVRSGPGLGYRVISHRRAQGRVWLVCKKHGSYVFGNRRWYRLAGNRGYVSAHYVRPRSAVRWC
ncbi:SH3 domain-containing protein [Streptomyces sp. NPDC001226]